MSYIMRCIRMEQQQGGIYMTNSSAPSSRRNRTVNLTVTAALAAIIIVMTFTPIGYLNIGIVEITFLTIPVAIGAIVCGPACGATLGAVFGVTSFMQCLGIGRPSPFGMALFSINPLSTALLCFVPRILMGLLAGLIFKAFKKKNGTVSYAVTALSTGVLNTLFFVGILITCFSTESLTGLQLGENIRQIIAALITGNSVIEWAVCLVVGLSVSKALNAVIKTRR